MGKAKINLAILTFFICSAVCAQKDFSAETWRFIDTSVDRNRNLADVLNVVKDLREKAILENKYFYVARCYYYEMLIKDQRTEDTFYFKNSAFIDSILSSKQSPEPLQFCMQIMLAKRINVFAHRSLKFQRERYARSDIPVNYAIHSGSELDSIVRFHFKEAKELAKKIAIQNAGEALWLSSDPLQFLFKPGLFDIVIAEQINTVNQLNYPPDFLKDKIAQWLKLSPEKFIENLDLFTDTFQRSFPVLALYSEWLSYHDSDQSSRYFIESLTRKYAYNLIKYNNDSAAKDYENYLEQIAVSGYSPVKAHGIYQLCLLWNSQSLKYFPTKGFEYDYRTNNYRDNKDYDSAYRYHALKALRLFEANKIFLDSFLYLKNILLRMEEQIRENEITITIDQNNFPGEPMLAEVKFKNADSLYYRICAINNSYSFTFKREPEFINRLLLSPIIINKTVALPQTSDLNYHATYLKLDGLPAGHYYLLFSHKPVKDTSYKIDYIFFNVTNIAVVNNDKRVYVLHRKTGMPLAGAKVKATYYKQKNDVLYSGSAGISKSYNVNRQGYVTIADNKYDNLEIYYNGDTAFEKVNYQEQEKPEDIYDKEEYNDLIEFYEENATAHVFTDRSIYRPGQTVHYKVLFLTKNRKTGEAMVMNKKNLEGKLFGSVYKKWLKEEEPLLYINDPFNKEMDSLKIIPNEFGSISGSYKIPKTAATGEWSIEPDYIDVAENTGTFKVEEYKKPSYEITIDKPKKELLPGDEFSFKIKVRSFAGASLNNVRINYSVTRRGELPANILKAGGNANAILSDTVDYTNTDGELEINIKDSVLRLYMLDKNKRWDFNYDMDAEAIDATGESYEASGSVLISSRPVLIRLPFADKYNRSDLPSLSITADDRNAGAVSKKIDIKIYKIEKKEKLYRDRNLIKPDTWLYPKDDLQNIFPDLDILQEESKETKTLVFHHTITTGEKLQLDQGIFTAGNYEAEATCIENGLLIGEAKDHFIIFDEKRNELAQPSWSFYSLPFNSALPGDTLKYFYGNSEKDIYSIFHIAYYDNKKKTGITYYYEQGIETKGIHHYELKIPSTAVSLLKLTQVYILNNQVFKHEESIYINEVAIVEPEIIVERYRKKLSPGSKEIFSVSIKTKNESIAAELMTTMYDASLDKLEEHKWEKPVADNNYRYINLSWPATINSSASSLYFGNNMLRKNLDIQRSHPASPLWWVNPLDYYYGDVMGDWSAAPHPNLRRDVAVQYDDFSPGGGYFLSGRAAGLNIASTEGLNEVVVVGYGTVSKRANLTSAISIRIRGASSLASYARPLIILDGVPYEGDINKIDPNTITAGLVLKGADATAIYGSRASEGVLLLSTKGEIVFPKEPEPVIIPRKNFSETAFFFPAIHADKDGYYSFSFTMPESVTEWNWKMLAHTKKAQFAYLEKKLNTQLPLMVQPNMPRLLYQGDRIVLQSRISNLDSTNASGNIICKIEDDETGEDITSKLLTVNQNSFSVAKKSNISSAFEIKVPPAQLHPLRITVSVRSENFMDGEEHIIPVLSPKIFVRESMPFVFINNTDTAVQLPPLPTDAEVYGMGLSIRPKPQSALINSLPYLANYPYGCAEQTFNKLLAHITALYIMRTDSAAGLSFGKAKAFVENEKPSSNKLPDELAEETMPWLNISDKTILQQKQLFSLLDTSKTIPAIEELLQKLYKLQNSDGGLSWFTGGKSDFYISCYVLKGFGRLQRDKQLTQGNIFDNAYRSFVDKLVKFCDNVFAVQANNDRINYKYGYYLYARGYWMNSYQLSDSINSTIKKLLIENWKKTDRASLYNQSLLILASLQFADKNNDLYIKAKKQLVSIRQMAIEDEQNGLRWKELADADDLTNSSEETITLLAEAFEAAGTNINSEVIKWLMTAKNEHNWKSTKATAAAIDLLTKENKSATGISQSITTKAGDSIISVTDDLLKGSSFEFAITSLSSSVQIKKETSTPASGNLSWYYFTSSGQLSSLNKDVRIGKQFYKWNDKGNTWTILGENEILKIADKVKVVIAIQSSKALSYVYIDDKRAAAFEPVDNSSSYEYAAGFSYYKSVRDAGFQFFADYIPSGKHEITYELKVAQEGSFTSGPSVLQCMYKPEISAYSNSIKINSGK